MCHHCNYKELLTNADLAARENRVRVLEVIGNNSFPLSARDIFNTLHRNLSINKVTVYRILDLLVDHGLVQRVSTAGRSFYYCLAPNVNHKAHAHFYCKICGQMDCLSPESLTIDMETLLKVFPGQIDNVEVRLDGICKNCRRNQ